MITQQSIEIACLSKGLKDREGVIGRQGQQIKSLGSEVNVLANEVEIKDGLLGESEKKLRDREKEIDACKETIRLLQRKKYAPQSEVVNSHQLSLFNEAEDIFEKEKAEVKDDDEDTPTNYKSKKPKRRPRIPKSLPRVEKIIALDGKDRICPHDGTELEEIGEESSEQLEIIPAQVRVIKTIRKKYACPRCHGGVKIPELPPALLPKSMASPSLIAYIIMAKYGDSLPLYRQERIFERMGIIIARQTMARWLVNISLELIPLYNLLQERLLEDDYLQMDETTIQVLKEEDRKATSKSYIWARHRPGNYPIVLFDYAPTRKGDIPRKLLEGFKGYLQCDGYDGYQGVCQENNLVRVGCMDHCRRKFYDAYKAAGKKKGVGRKGLIFLRKLYKIEREIKGCTEEIKKEVRQSKSMKILEEMKEWIDEVRGKITPTSLGGKAINYAFNEWKYLTAYTTNGKLNISNAWIENKIRPFCVGRKNWLFSDSVAGAEASAMYYSLIETAKANGLEPFDYLMKLLENLPHARTVEDYERLLPLRGRSSPEGPSG